MSSAGTGCFPPAFLPLPDHRPTPRHGCDRTLPHRCPRRPDRAVRPLRPPPLLLSLLPQPPLPQVPSPLPGPRGSASAAPNCSTAPTSTSSSPSPSRSQPSPCRTRASSTPCCCAPPPAPCAPSSPIPNTSGPRSASSPSCILGARLFSYTLTCTASSPAAASLPAATAGSPAAPASSSPSRTDRSASAGGTTLITAASRP